MATSRSPAPVLARVRVADAELDVLFLVAQYLRALGLSTTVVALLRESGLDPSWLCGASRELALLREWVFQGEWPRVRALLSPLGDVLGERGLAAALACVDQQALLEEFHLAWTPSQRRREILEQLLTQSSNNALAQFPRQERQRCVEVLQGDRLPGQSGWSLDEARLACFESLVPLFRDAIQEDDDEHKYLAMPHRQLVALLNDALLLHRERGGYHEDDIVSVTPISPDTLAVESDVDCSSLRLVEPGQTAVYGDALSRSVDLSRLSGKDHGMFSGGDSKPIHARNPLVMSMALPGVRPGRARDGAQRDIGRESDESALHAESVDDAGVQSDSESRRHEARSVEDAETQTESVLSVDQAIETAEQPAISSMATNPCIKAVEHETFDRSPFERSNQNMATGGEQEPARPSSVFRASKMETAAANAPLEAWCTSRRGENPEQDHAGDDIFRDDALTGDNDEDFVDQQIDTEDPADNTNDKDEDPEQAHSDDEEPTNTSLRSYSQLTIDSVVRANVIAEVREAQAIRAMDIAPDGSEMVIGTNARALRVFDLTEPLASSSLSSSGGLSFLPLLPVSLERHKHHASSIYTACYNHVSPAHAAPLIASGAAESSIKVLARWTQQEVWIRGHSGKSRALCFASRNVLCSASSGDMVIRAWDVDASSTSSPPCIQRFDGHVGEIQAMAISATSAHDTSGPLDRRCFVSTSMDRTMRLWDLRSAQCARVLARTGSPAFTLAFQPHMSATKVLATGHQDGSVSLWDMRATSASATKPLATVSHHQDECRAVSWSPDGQWLLSGSFDGTLCLMEANGRDVSAVASFHQHDDKILQAQWHPTQPAIVTTGADKLVKLWAFT